MSDELSRRNFLALAGAATMLDTSRLSRRLMALLPAGGHSAAVASVVRGQARFQVLSPTLVRMEYVPSGHFVDLPSVSVPNRNWPACPFRVHDAEGWVEIETSRMHVKYKLDSGRFASGTLVVNWTDGDGEHSWKPGDTDDKNLGGVPGLFEGVVPVSVTPGPLSRNGYFWLDDSGTAVWNPAIQWPEPRSGREEAQDWYFFVYGHDYKACLQELARLLGPIPMVPRYVFGTWYGSQEAFPADEYRRIVHRFREEGIPLDILILDSVSTAILIWSGFSWDPEQFPDPKGFFAWMKTQGVKVTVNEHDSDITPESDSHFEQVREALGLPAGTTHIRNNLGDKKYAQLYMDVMHKPALDMGMAFWWQDESGATDIPGLDAQFWCRHVEYEGQERLTGKRTFAFSRLHTDNAHPSRPPQWGVHRYGGYFTGDFYPDWQALERLVPFNVQSGNVLVPYVSSVIGGDYPYRTLDQELYQRWVQFTAFAPLFWWHGPTRLPWEFGEQGQAAARQYLTLRYRLLPYIYTHSRLAHETGAPLVRGTWLEYPEQERAYTFNHQYLFGQAILVAPITQPGDSRPVRKEIYLPEGEHWFDYFTGQIYAGGQVLSYDCPLSRMPLFVKAGSILPMAPEMDSTDDYPVDYLVLDIYAGKPAAFRLYEDDGVSLDYRKQAYAWTSIRYSLTQGKHVITIGPAEGRYQGQPQARSYRIQVHGLFRPARVLVQDREAPEKRQRGNPAADGWVWRPIERVTAIDLIAPVATREIITVTLEQAGAFPDAVIAQSVWAYRERVRRVKLAVKLHWAVTPTPKEVKKQPHVLEETERVEQTLNDLIDHGADLATRPVDFKGMTAAILGALVTQPFDSTRRLPEPDPDAVKATQVIAHATFMPEELHSMTAELLACDLTACVTSGEGPSCMINSQNTCSPQVEARFLYDTRLIDPPQVGYELTLPLDDTPPGWGVRSRELHPDGSATFVITAPFPPPPGAHTMRLRATATWGANQTVLEREVVWVVNPDAPFVGK